MFFSIVYLTGSTPFFKVFCIFQALFKSYKKVEHRGFEPYVTIIRIAQNRINSTDFERRKVCMRAADHVRTKITSYNQFLLHNLFYNAFLDLIFLAFYLNSSHVLLELAILSIHFNREIRIRSCCSDDFIHFRIKTIQSFCVT